MYHLDEDVRKVIEFLQDAKHHISDVVHYLLSRRSEYILSEDQAMSIVNNVLNDMDHSRATLEKTSEKMSKINVAVKNRLKKLDLD